jgi:hypothetical protein
MWIKIAHHYLPLQLAIAPIESQRSTTFTAPCYCACNCACCVYQPAGAPQHEAHQLAMAFQVAVSHSTTALSSAADINSAPSELNASTRTAAAWPPRSLVTIAPLPTSTMRMHVPAANATTGEVGWAATQRVSGRSCAAFPPGQISNASSRPFYAPSVLVVVVGAVEI